MDAPKEVTRSNPNFSTTPAGNFPASSLSKALPDGFGFYHLGEVVSAPPALSKPETWEDPEAIRRLASVAFRIYDEAGTWVVILFDQQLDQDIYAEMGNILAGQFATWRQKQTGGGTLMISPPRKLSHSILARWAQAHPPTLQKSYLHRLAGQGDEKTIPVHALVLTAREQDVPEEQGGHA